MVAGADLWVYNDEKFCVLIFYQVASIFHLRVGGWGNKIIWANLLTTMIYQGGFHNRNVVTPFLGGFGAGQKFSEAIFNITRPLSLLSDPHFFARVRILPPSWQCQYFPSLPFPSHKQLTLILFTQVGIWIYPRILGEGTQIDCSFLLSSNM